MKCMSVNAPSTGADLAEQYRRQGWKTSSETIKVFCWGFAGWSLSKALTKHRLVALTNKRASKSITDGTEKALADSSPGLIGQAGSRVQCLRMNFAPGLGPPPMQLLRPLHYSLQHKNLSFN